MAHRETNNRNSPDLTASGPFWDLWRLPNRSTDNFIISLEVRFVFCRSNALEFRYHGSVNSPLVEKGQETYKVSQDNFGVGRRTFSSSRVESLQGPMRVKKLCVALPTLGSKKYIIRLDVAVKNDRPYVTG